MLRHGLRNLSSMSLKTLETLNFDNAALADLPVDNSRNNVPRQVPNACFARVAPTPLASPSTVVYSTKAMELIDLPKSELDRPDFPSYLCGSKEIPGADYAAHCYCGHQFGYFSGQLGDGATMYVGEVVNSKNERWEIQFKGAGKTPFSRSADGRKVLRSSIREFLASEAMYHLGVPTTRAGSCVVSTDTVVRDVFYTGRNVHEKCTVILRIAPTFLRFGSFEIFKSIDRVTSRVGSSPGKTDILNKMLDYTLQRFYPEISREDKETAVVELYRAIMERTARLVAKWQAVGFCHGVLNTDNMSVMGITIDYGPYGFMETYDPAFICNGSDKGGRYTYQAQPAICKWNVGKLGEMFSLVVPQQKLNDVLSTWDTVYNTAYLEQMRSKLGLLSIHSSDLDLVEELLTAMYRTQSDFTNTFLRLQDIDIVNGGIEECVEGMVSVCLPLHLVTKFVTTTYSKEDCDQLLKLVRMYASREDGYNPLAMYGIEPEVVIRDAETHRDLERLAKMTAEDKDKMDRDVWRVWLSKFKARLEEDHKCQVDDMDTYNRKRKEVMAAANPKVIPRNHVLQRAISDAENGDYDLVRRLRDVFEEPYTTPVEQWMCERELEKPPCVVT